MKDGGYTVNVGRDIRSRSKGNPGYPITRMDRPVHSDALPGIRCKSGFMMQRNTTGSANNVVSMYTNTIFIFECRKLREIRNARALHGKIRVTIRHCIAIAEM